MQLTKDEILILLMKAAAIYLFVLAALTLASLPAALLQIFYLWRMTASAISGETTIGQNLVGAAMSKSVTDLVSFVACIVVGKNLYNGGSWMRRLFRSGAGHHHRIEPTGENARRSY